MWLAALWLTCLGEWSAALLLALAPDPRLSAGPVLAALLLEGAAIPLPVGSLSLAHPLYLAMLLHPGIGLTPVLLCSTLAALARSVRYRLPAGELPLALIPLLSAGLVARIPGLHSPWRELFVAQVYLILAWQLPALVAPRVLSEEALVRFQDGHRRSVILLVGLAGLGLLLASYPGNPAWLLLAVPVLLALRPSARAVGIEVELWSQAQLRHQLAQERQISQHTRAQLVRSTDQVALLESLSQSLARHPDPLQVVDLILQIAGQLVSCQSLVFLGPQEGRLVPLRCRSPHAERIGASALLAIADPQIERAFREGGAQLGRGGPSSLVPGEMVLALGLGPLGVLYVGDARRASYTPDEVERLRMLASQGRPCLQSAHDFLRMQSLLARNEEALEHVQRYLNGLTGVLEAARALADGAEVSALLATAVGQLVPCDFLWLQRHPDEPCPDPELALLGELAGGVHEHGRPLLYDELAGTRFATPRLGGVLAVPAGAGGVLMVGTRQPHLLNRTHQDLLAVLGYLAGAALRNAESHQQVVDAYRRLQLSEAQLIESAKGAAIGQLAAGVAHELNTPLCSIVLGLDSALDNLRKAPERAESQLRNSHLSASKMQGIVAKLLHYTREGKLDEQAVDLNEIVRDTLELLAQPLRDLPVRLELGEIPVVTGNQTAFQQVVSNLLLNARDFGAQEVLVSTRREPGALLLEVQDDGAGVDPTVRAQIFDPFFTTRPLGQGVGLGLSAAREIVQRHGGTLTLEDSPRGARFQIRLAIP